MADPTAGTGWVERSLEHLVTPESKKTLEKNKYGGGCHTDTAIRIAWYWHTDQWVRTRSPEINPQIQSNDFDKSAKIIQWGKERLFNKRCWGDLTPACKGEAGRHLSPHAGASSKRAKNLHVRPGTGTLVKTNKQTKNRTKSARRWIWQYNKRKKIRRHENF